MFSRSQKNEVAVITEGFSKEVLLDLYDENYGFSIVVNAIEREVDVPSYLKNETKLTLNITRSTTSEIYFEENSLVCVLTFKNKKHKCLIPYKYIREATPIGYAKKKNFWQERLDKKKFYIGAISGIGIAWFFVCVFSLIYAYQTDISIYGFSYFHHTQSFWNDESSLFVFKFFAMLIAMIEAYFIFVIGSLAPVVVASHYFGWSTLTQEVVLTLYFGIGILLMFIFSRFDDKPKEPSLMELNLELLGLRPIFKKKKFNVKNDFCFYVGPFSEEYTKIYNNDIQKPISDVGLKIQRADEIFGTLPVMDDIWNVMNECSILIAELSGRNPNVMYEIGMAHTIGKKVIIITQNNADIPFDLRHHRCLLYDNNEEGRLELSNKLLSTIKYELGIV